MLTIEQTRQQVVSEMRQIVRSANRAVRWCALFWWLTVVLATLIALALLDCVLRREEVGMRWLQFLTWLSVAGYWAYRWLLPSLRFVAKPIDLARWIEQQRPTLAGQLSTVLELSQLDPRDHRFGSGSFQEAALRQWTQASHAQSWQAHVDATPMQRAGVAFLCLALLTGLFSIVWPVESGLAFRRTLQPWASNRWPQQDQLQLDNLPEAVGQGAVIQLEITDTRPPLPDSVLVQLRYLDASQVEPVVIAAQRLGDIAVASLPPLNRDVQLRAIGGDDQSMPWQNVRVLAVPVWNNFRFQVELPEYAQTSTARALRITDAQQLNTDGTYHVSRQQLQVLKGSRVHFQGELNQSVQAAMLLPESDSLRSEQRSRNPQRTDDHPSEAQQPFLAELDSSGKVVSWQILPQSAWDRMPTAHWKFQFRVDEQTQLISGQDWRIEILEDQVPMCELTEGLVPSLAVGGHLKLVGQARDDWGLQQVKAKMSFDSRQDLELELPIDIQTPTHECPVRVVWDFEATAAAQGCVIAPQEQILIWLEAKDQLGQLGISQKLPLTIETPARQLELITSKQIVLGQKVRELLDAQQSGQLAARQLAEQLERGDKIDQATRQSLQTTIEGVMNLQQSIHEQLFESPQSVQGQLKQMLEALEANQLTGSEQNQHWQSLEKILHDQAVHPARKAWEAALQWQSEVQSANANTSEESHQESSSRLDLAQSQLLQALQQLVDRLNGQAQFGRLRGQLISVANAQRSLSKQVADLQVDLSEFGENSTQAQWRQITDQQRRLTNQLETWIGQAQAVIQAFGLSDTQKNQLQSAVACLIDGQAVSIARDATSSLQARNLSQLVDNHQRLHGLLQAALKHLGEIDRFAQQGLDSSSAEPNGDPRQLDQLKQRLERLVLMQQELMPQYKALGERLQQPVDAQEYSKLSASLLQQQDTVKQDLQKLMDSIDSQPTLEWLGQQILQDLTRAIAATQRQRVSPEAIDAADGALRKLSLAADSLAEFMLASQDRSEESKSQQSTDNATDIDQPDQQWTSPQVVSLILLRNLQRALQEQTATLNEITDVVRRRTRQTELTRLQRELAVRLEELILQSLSTTAPETSGQSVLPKEIP